MSANNHLIIEKYGRHYRISDVDVDGGGGYMIDNVKYQSQKKAIEAAEKYMEKNEVEYGIHYKIIKK